MQSSSLSTRDTYEVDIENLIQRTFDLATENAEFSILNDSITYYIGLACVDSISKVKVVIKIKDIDGNVISNKTLYITKGLYHIEVNDLKIFMYLDKFMAGFIANVEN